MIKLARQCWSWLCLSAKCLYPPWQQIPTLQILKNTHQTYKAERLGSLAFSTKSKSDHITVQGQNVQMAKRARRVEILSVATCKWIRYDCSVGSSWLPECIDTHGSQNKRYKWYDPNGPGAFCLIPEFLHVIQLQNFGSKARCSG